MRLCYVNRVRVWVRVTYRVRARYTIRVRVRVTPEARSRLKLRLRARVQAWDEGFGLNVLGAEVDQAWAHAGGWVGRLSYNHTRQESLCRHCLVIRNAPVPKP